MKTIKKFILLVLVLIMAYSAAQAQNDTMYVYKAGAVIYKQSIKVADVDSIIFYNPVTPNYGISTVTIPAGTFSMGSSNDEVNRSPVETLHLVMLSTFRMSKYEITNAQYAAFLNAKSIGLDGIWAAGAYPTQILIYASSDSYDWGLNYTSGQWVPAAGYENHPVINVTWYGATEYATYAGGCLPTEAEWGYACRAGSFMPFNTGTCLTNTQANYHWAYPYDTCCTNTNTTFPGKPQQVGTYAPNAFGLYDMHGNVREWCSDWYADYLTEYQINPTGAHSGSSRVIRGGSWADNAQYCRSAYRVDSYPDHCNLHNIGFRVVFAP
jgi:formylglycine-generating enzyme required for sulfatase activity